MEKSKWLAVPVPELSVIHDPRLPTWCRFTSPNPHRLFASFRLDLQTCALVRLSLVASVRTVVEWVHSHNNHTEQIRGELEAT